MGWDDMIKLFACDLDGTLLNAFHDTDRVILRAVREIAASGAHIAIATGRTMASSHDHGFQGAPVELLGSNASIIRDSTGRVLKTFPLDKAVLEDLLRAFPDVCFECVAPDGTFATGTPEALDKGFKGDNLYVRIAMRGMRTVRGNTMTRHEVAFGQTPAQVLAHEICKINCRVPDEGRRRELSAYIAEHQDTLVDAPFDPVMFEITARGVNKGSGVAWLAAHYGYTEDEVAVYGDGGNDIAMLERFEHAYATKGASEAAKRAAGTVIGSCAFHAVPRHMLKTLKDQRAYTQVG